MSGYTFRLYTSRNTVGGGYFRVAELWRGERRVARRVFDGTFLRKRADRKAVEQVREWRDLYEAVPR